MTALGTLRSRFSRRDDVSSRLEGLETAIRAAGGRLDPELVSAGEEVLARARDRMRLSADHTIVALAGATGSGKSSLFNRLCGLDVAAVGVRRPTTSWTLACAWGTGAEEMLEWLGVPGRHQINRASLLDVSEPELDLQGLVLLDLPDHDSTEVSHHLEVERLVGLADVLIWVLDPQKYADAAIHDRFLRPLASHREVMIAVFNHVDELSDQAATETLADLRRLLVADGLVDLPMIPTSATRGDGLPELRAEIVKRVAQKRSARTRMSADIDNVARRLSAAIGTSQPREEPVGQSVEGSRPAPSWSMRSRTPRGCPRWSRPSRSRCSCAAGRRPDGRRPGGYRGFEPIRCAASISGERGDPVSRPTSPLPDRHCLLILPCSGRGSRPPYGGIPTWRAGSCHRPGRRRPGQHPWLV